MDGPRHISTSTVETRPLPPPLSQIPSTYPHPNQLPLIFDTYSSQPLSAPPLPSDPQQLWRNAPNSRAGNPRQFDHVLPPVKYEPSSPRSSSGQLQQHSREGNDDGTASTSNFVTKLYEMLEDQTFSHIVSWGPQGDCFVVKDASEFSKSILPRMFKHSNFASFVRQLNKYDFHKVKNSDDSQFGERSWAFHHPDFRADRRDALESIKRKVPMQCKPSSTSLTNACSSSSALESLQSQVERLAQSQEEHASHIRLLERSYRDVLSEIVTFQQVMVQQDQLVRNLLAVVSQWGNGESCCS